LFRGGECDMKKILVPIVLAWLVATPTNALTTAEAQQCANRLLDAYNTKNYPAETLLIEVITSRTFGVTYRSMSDYEKINAREAIILALRKSFEKPTGKYQYKNMLVKSVENTRNGFRIRGDVFLSSPKYTGPITFMVLVYPGCKIEQARIGDIYSLDTTLREILKKEARWRNLLK